MKTLFINATKFRWCSQMVANNHAQSGERFIGDRVKSMVRAGFDLESSESVYDLRTHCMTWSQTPQGGAYWATIRERRDEALGD